uniref:Reverse transcriptase Ty1/copia-type domain-containing protein n=1 Tax=Tanacetum cinerariifolium TaxID=118510 RepID=A0A6L2M9B0_TANCI|nr:hypothetical protein [Tanacetum cinerariifolium]
MDSEVMEGSKKTQAEWLEKEDDTIELKRCLEIVPEDDDDVTIKATPISSKSPTIVDYKIYKEGKKSYFKIIKADGTSQNYLTFGTMFKNFNREDLEVLRSIVKERFKKTKPVNDMDNLLIQTLKTMFEHHVKDNIWKYQQVIDVKNAFLNGKLSEEVYVQQPRGFKSSEFPIYVCNMDKALYWLKQAPRAWYETLSKFLIQHKFVRGAIDNPLFTYKTKSDVIIVKKYVKDLLKKYELADCALVKCTMLLPNNLGPDKSRVFVNKTRFSGMIGSMMYLTSSRPHIQSSTYLCVRSLVSKRSCFDLKAYTDSDYAGCKLDRKGTLKGCQILGGKLVCWSVKKQSSVAMSLADAKIFDCLTSWIWRMYLAGYAVLGIKPKLSPVPEETLILPFGGVNADDTIDKSLSRTALTQSKASNDKRPRRRKSHLPLNPRNDNENDDDSEELSQADEMVADHVKDQLVSMPNIRDATANDPAISDFLVSIVSSSSPSLKDALLNAVRDTLPAFKKQIKKAIMKEMHDLISEDDQLKQLMPLLEEGGLAPKLSNLYQFRTSEEGVVGRASMVIRELEAGMFLYNGNFDLVFQRKKARPNFVKAREIDEKNLDDRRAMKGLAKCIASARNLRRIQVREIVKEVDDYLKTYSSVGMDIRWYVDGIR